MPTGIRPLRPGRSFLAQKPHESELCQKCIELGYSCREYTPTAESVDFPDDQSVISEASTASASSLLEDQDLSDGELTPVGSDTEEELLEAKMKKLNLSKRV